LYFTQDEFLDVKLNECKSSISLAVN